MSESFVTDKKLGFGLMRLPKLADDPSKIDIEQTKEMVDLFMDAGFSYFDTAYVYDGGGSELAAREALVDRYPRESFTIATKVNPWLGRIDKETARKELDVSMERLGVDYVDFYLLHAIQPDNEAVYEDYDLWNLVRQAKKDGKVKHWGFSFHGTPEQLDRLLTENPDVEFVQLQINYADWENLNIASRKCYEICRKHGKEVTIMEPVKGGQLADPIPEIKELFNSVNPDASPASWAIRFAASLDGVITVLSGMSNIEQMKDNISFMKEFKPLNDKEREVIEKATDIISRQKTIPCTGCHYCTEGCPCEINIPMIIRAVNELNTLGIKEAAQKRYGFATNEGGKAGDCIQCGQCESACPQHLEIISHMATASELFD